MKPTWKFFAPLLIVLSLTSCKKDKEDGPPLYPIYFVSENLYPYNYREGNTAKGLCADALNYIAASQGMYFDIYFSKTWEEAYKMTEEGSDIVLLSCAITPERKDKFNWAGPMAAAEVYFYSLASLDPVVSPDQIKENGYSIATVKDYGYTESLKAEGYTVNEYASPAAAVAAVRNGTDQLTVLYSSTAARILSGMGLPENTLAKQAFYRTEFLYMAFSKKIPDYVFTTWQSALGVVVSTGKMEQIQKKYSYDITPVGLQQIFTTDENPFNFISPTNDTVGSSVEMVRTIQKGNSKYYPASPVRFSTWEDASQAIGYVPLSVMFSVPRTPETQSLYRWVGPIGIQNSVFYVKTDSGVSIPDENSAKNLKIATIKGHFTEDYLRENEYNRIMVYSTPQDALAAVNAGTEDAAFLLDVTFASLPVRWEYNVDPFSVGLNLNDNTETYIALSLNTPDNVYRMWKDTYTNYKNLPHVFPRIWENWYGLTFPKPW